MLQSDGTETQGCDGTFFCDNYVPDGEACCHVSGEKVGCSASNFDGNQMNETLFDTSCPNPVTCGAAASSVSFVAVLAFLVAFKELF